MHLNVDGSKTNSYSSSESQSTSTGAIAFACAAALLWAPSPPPSTRFSSSCCPLFRPLSGRNPTATFPSVWACPHNSCQLPCPLSLTSSRNWSVDAPRTPATHLHCPYAFRVYLPAVFVCFLLVFSPSVVIAAAPSPTGPMRVASSSSALVFHFVTKKLSINSSAKASSLTLTTFDPLGSLASKTSCFVFELSHALAPQTH